MNAALAVIGLTVLVALGFGLRARRGREMSPEQWTVGGRGFGVVIVFLLMAGEIYTTFTVPGGSGYAYGKGDPALYILGYGALAFILSYWLLPGSGRPCSHCLAARPVRVAASPLELGETAPCKRATPASWSRMSAACRAVSA